MPPAEPKEPRTEAGKALLGRPATKHRHCWLDGSGTCLTCGTTRTYVPVEKGIELGRPTAAEIVRIEDQAATEARRELLAKVEGLADEMDESDPMRGPGLGEYADHLRRLIEEPSDAR